MADKRRRARLQGTWSVPNNLPQLRPAVDRMPAQPVAPFVGGAQFCYQATNKVFRQKPVDIMIEKEGRHVLSTTPEGFECSVTLYPDFLPDVNECASLFRSLSTQVEWQEKSGAIRGVTFQLPRLVAWFGPLPYHYAGVTMPAQQQWLPIIHRLHDRIAERTGHEFNSVLLNLYRNGRDSVAWHSDSELLMGVHPTIASLSLGDTRMFEMRHKVDCNATTWTDQDFEMAQHVKIPLKAGSLLVMDGQTQAHWQHRIPKEFHDRKPRINLTFRTVYPNADLNPSTSIFNRVSSGSQEFLKKS